MCCVCEGVGLASVIVSLGNMCAHHGHLGLGEGLDCLEHCHQEVEVIGCGSVVLPLIIVLCTL